MVMGAEGDIIRKVFQARKKVAAVLKKLASEQRSYLAKLKRKHQPEFERYDFVWLALLRSFSTMGSSRGSKGLSAADTLRNVGFEALKNQRPSERQKVLLKALRSARVRWPKKKAEWLERDFQRIEELGGPKRAKRALLSAQGCERKINFLRTFEGIGPKYARNIMMDVYHDEFRDRVALDARIQEISRLLGLSFNGYEEHEQFYLDSAHDAGLNGWELDRLIYNFKDQVKSRLSN